MTNTIGIDIGGANTKVASLAGNARSFYLPLWRGHDLEGLLRRVRHQFHPERVGIVITGELVDAFQSKQEGICSIAASVNSVFAKAFFMNVCGHFTPTIARNAAHLYAASNWIASATYLAKSSPDCIFVDLGSTTCDVVPIRSGKPVAQKRDFDRLRDQELIYTGILRNNIAALLRVVNLRRKRYRLSTELFAITADVHRVLGNISEADYTCDTPDARGHDLEACYRRIARVLLCDLSELGTENAHEIARQVEHAQVNALAEALAFQAQRFQINTVVGAGLGEFLIAKAALKAGFECRLLSEEYGRKLSNVFPAFAVAQLAQNV